MTPDSSPVRRLQSRQERINERAGRDLASAIGIGVTLGALVLAILLAAPVLWVPLLAVVAFLATYEVFKRMRTAGIRLALLPLLVGGQALVWSAYGGARSVLAAFVGTVLAIYVWRLFLDGRNHTPRNYLRDASTSVLVATWIPLGLSFAALLHLMVPGRGSQIIILFMIGVVGSDVGGYALGVLFGRHPMAPKVSPKKSWEGFCGSLLFAVTLMMALGPIMLDLPWRTCIIVGVGLVLSATLGDLVESQIKRDLNIKDMGTMLPGHGGLMDRLDGMLPSASMTWLLLNVVPGAFG